MGFVLPNRVEQPVAVFAMIIALLCVSFEALAHDPGLSAAELAVDEQSIKINLTFARRDIEQLVPLDLNQDNQVSSSELTGSLLPLEQLAEDSVEIVIGDQPQRIIVREIVLDPSDALVFSLESLRYSGGSFHFSVPVIPKMALGHRQFVTVVHNGKAVQAEILSATKTEMVISLQPLQWWRQTIRFVWEGIWHIWIGFDHILFLVAMLLPAALMFINGAWQPREAYKPTFVQVVKIVSAFTVAHSITLSLSVFELIRLDAVLVESVIAASVIFAAANNVRPLIRKHLWIMSFGFGLIHGFGFASVLSDLGMPNAAKGQALLGFNFGVEIGQLAIIVAILPLVFIFRDQQVYRVLFLKFGSVGIAFIAAIWLVERIAGWNFLASIIPTI